MDLRRFPFDIQRLETQFHPFLYSRDEIVPVPENRLARTVSHTQGIADWWRNSVMMAERPVEIAYFDARTSTVSEFVVTVEIQRIPTHMITSILLSMILLLSLTWLIFWMNYETFATLVNISFIGAWPGTLRAWNETSFGV